MNILNAMWFYNEPFLIKEALKTAILLKRIALKTMLKTANERDVLPITTKGVLNSANAIAIIDDRRAENNVKKNK